MDAVFRFGVLASLLIGVASFFAFQFQPNDEPEVTPGEPTGELGLLMNRDVQDELHLSREQIAKIRACRGELQLELCKITISHGDPANSSLSLDDPVEKGAALQRRIDAKVAVYDRKVESVLNPCQAERLNEIILQYQLVAGLNMEGTALKLGLTNAQKTRLRKVAVSTRHNSWSITMKRQIEDYALELLTDQQKQLLPILMGSEFKFSETQASRTERDDRG